MDLWTLKLISIFIISVVNFLSGFLPYFFISRKISHPRHSSPSHGSTSLSSVGLSSCMKRFLSLANFFCGGIFLAMCIIGLYPGVDHKFNQILKDNPHLWQYPYAGLSLALGFFSVWLLEILVHFCIHCHSPRSSGHSHHTISSMTNDHKSNHCTTKNSSDNIAMKSMIPKTPPTEELLLTPGQDDQEALAPEPKEDHEPHSHVPLSSGNLIGSVMLTFALGSHSLIEGLGFGVLDDMGTVVNMLATMLIHESICAVSLGINLACKKTSLVAALVLLVIFSILIPAGIGIGLIVDSNLQKDLFGRIVVAVLQGVAAGTFVYVVFMEILPNEMSHRKDPLWQLLAMFLGFVVIAIMKAFHVHKHVPRVFNHSTDVYRSTLLSTIIH